MASEEDHPHGLHDGSRKIKPTATHLKIALLANLRYKRQYVCVDEFLGADVIADTGKDVIEVEVKVDKRDLMHGEDKKTSKHQCYARGISWRFCHPNRYFFCVPMSLQEAAEAKIQQLNPKYGLILFNEEKFNRFVESRWGVIFEDLVVTVKRAGKLHDGYRDSQRTKIAKRASSKLITMMQTKFKEQMDEEARKRIDAATGRSH